MDKKKFRVAVLVPVLVVVVILGGVIYGVLQSGSSNNAIEPSTAAEAASTEEAVVESVEQGETAPGAAAGVESGAMPYDPGMAGPQGDPAACDFATLVGLRVPEALEQVRPLGRPFRVLSPGDAATQDFSPDRINLTIDEQGMVSSVTCG